MARNSEKSEGKRLERLDLSAKKLRSLWSKGTPEEWKTFLSIEAPSNKWIVKGRTVIGLCPFHQEDGASFTIFVDRGYAKCFGCYQYESDPLKVVARAISNGTRSLAFSRITERFGSSGFSKDYVEHLQEADLIREVKNTILQFSRRELIQALQNPDDLKYAYVQPLVAYLQKRIPLNLLHLFPIGVLPSEQALLTRLAEFAVGEEKRHLDNVALKAVEYLNKYFTDKFVGGLLLAYHLSPGVIGRFKIRIVGEKDFIVVADPFEHSLGFFGLDCYGDLVGQAIGSTAVLVEGEFDQLSLLARQAEEVMDCLILGTSGAGGIKNLDALRELGVERAILLPDFDKGGEAWARAIIAQTKELPLRVSAWPKDVGTDDDPDSYVKRDSNAFKRLWAFVHDRTNQAQPH